MPEDISLKVAKIEVELGNVNKRMDALEKLTDSVHKLALSLESLSIRQANAEEKIDIMAKDISTINSKPAKHMEAIVSAVIAALVGAFITFIIK